MSLVENINKRRKAGKSRSKKNSTISKKAYAAMKKGWKEKGGLSMKYMMAGMKKYAKGGFGSLSVKAGVDNNYSVTYADKIAGAKKKKRKGGLKDIPSSNKGLPNLSKKVRNKMGYKKYGGKK